MYERGGQEGEGEGTREKGGSGRKWNIFIYFLSYSFVVHYWLENVCNFNLTLIFGIAFFHLLFSNLIMYLLCQWTLHNKIITSSPFEFSFRSSVPLHLPPLPPLLHLYPFVTYPELFLCVLLPLYIPKPLPFFISSSFFIFR